MFGHVGWVTVDIDRLKVITLEGLLQSLLYSKMFSWPETFIFTEHLKWPSAPGEPVLDELLISPLLLYGPATLRDPFVTRGFPLEIHNSRLKSGQLIGNKGTSG